MNTFTNHTIKFFFMLVLVSGVMPVGMMSQAQAGDKKIYSGTMCKPIGNPKNVPIKYSNGAIYNFGKSLLFIICPVTRDNTSNTNGVKAWGFVGRNNYYGAAGFECALGVRDSSRGNSGGEILQGRSSVHLSYGNGSRTFEDYVRGPRKSASRGLSYYILTCKIPGWEPGKQPSYLASYYVEEN